MYKKILAGMCLGLTLAAACFTYQANASSVAGETQMAGVSMMIQDYYYSCAAKDQITDPEAIVPVYDNNYDDTSGVDDMIGAVNVPERDIAPDVQAGAADDSVVTDAAIGTDDSVVTDAAIGTDGAVATDSAIDVSGTAEGQLSPDEIAAREAAAAQAQAEAAEEAAFANVGISIANEYVNIRRRPNTESKILGKLYRGNAATILETKGEWVRIKSGSVEGYIKSEFLAIGSDARRLADKFGTKLAKVVTTTLKVRKERNTECTVLTLVPEDEVFEVLKEYDDWVKIEVDESTKGYVSKDYVELSVEFGEAISIEEEEAIIREREEAAAEAEREAERIAAAAAEAAEAQRRAQQSSSSSSDSSHKSSSSSSSHKSSSSSSGKSSSSSSSSSRHSDTSKVSTGSGTGSDAAAYAQKFIGNPYSYGGTSLTNGTDCSGFVQSVYSKYGVSLPRTSSSQASSGSKVSLDNLKPGDLVFYAADGSVNHVAMYIGDGKVVHASNKRTGITTSNINYRTPHSARRVAE